MRAQASLPLSTLWLQERMDRRCLGMAVKMQQMSLHQYVDNFFLLMFTLDDGLYQRYHYTELDIWTVINEKMILSIFIFNQTYRSSIFPLLHPLIDQIMKTNFPSALILFLKQI